MIGGVGEVDVTARTSCGFVDFRECSELLYGRRFPVVRKWTVDTSYLWPVFLYGSEVWGLREMGVFLRIQIHGESNMCGTAQR